MLKKLNKGKAFVSFALNNIRPRSLAVRLVAAKLAVKLFTIPWQNISFDFLSPTRLSLTLNDIEQLTYFFNLFYSGPFRISKPISNSPTIVDGGANVGMSSVYFYSKYPDARIYAIEPSRENVDLLKINLSQLPHVKIDQVAIWEETKELVLNMSSCTRYNSYFSISENCQSVTVKGLCLSDWLEENRLRKIDILKLNVEGAEASAIKGLGKRIGDVGVIVGEIHPQFVDKEMFLNELERNNFTLSRIEKFGKATWAFEAHNRSFHGA